MSSIMSRMFGLRQKKYGFLIKKRVLLENTVLNWIWLITGVYKAPIQKDEIFLRNLNFVLNKHSSKYKNITDSRF